MAQEVPRDAVIAFRLAAHGLLERSEGDGLLPAAGRSGVQNSPPGSALLALHARVRGATQEAMERAVAEQKSLLQSWSMRGAPFFFPTADAAVFTAGVLPPTEEARRRLVLGVEQAVDRLGVRLSDAVELCAAEVRGVLTGRRLAIEALGAELAERVAGRLPKAKRGLWAEEGPYAPGQPLGEAVVHFCLRILCLQGLVCFAPREGNKAPFVLVDEWLGAPIPEVDPEVARAELLRRYLRCYGPSTPADFAAWLGVRAGDTRPWWSLLEEALVPVAFGGRSWILGADLEALRSAAMPKGVRLLPPRDPYTQMRDRATIVDGAFQRTLWKTVGEPGAVLLHGRIAGAWRPRKSGRKLTVTVQAFAPLAERDRKALREEAERIAPLRGASTVAVEFGDP